MVKKSFTFKLIASVVAGALLVYAAMLSILLYMPAMRCCPIIF